MCSSDLRTPVASELPPEPWCQPCFATVLASLCFSHILHNFLDLQALLRVCALANTCLFFRNSPHFVRKIANISGRDKLQKLSFNCCGPTGLHWLVLVVHSTWKQASPIHILATACGWTHSCASFQLYVFLVSGLPLHPPEWLLLTLTSVFDYRHATLKHCEKALLHWVQTIECLSRGSYSAAKGHHLMVSLWSASDKMSLHSTWLECLHPLSWLPHS